MDTSNDQPEATEEEQEQAADPSRRNDEEAMRYPGHDDPEEHGPESSAGEDGV
jgi:hypothetical protein